MKGKSMELKKDNKKSNLKKDTELNLKAEAVKSQEVSVNFWGEGPFDDELILNYEY